MLDITAKHGKETIRLRVEDDTPVATVRALLAEATGVREGDLKVVGLPTSGVISAVPAARLRRLVAVGTPVAQQRRDMTDAAGVVDDLAPQIERVEPRRPRRPRPTVPSNANDFVAPGNPDAPTLEAAARSPFEYRPDGFDVYSDADALSSLVPGVAASMRTAKSRVVPLLLVVGYDAAAPELAGLDGEFTVHRHEGPLPPRTANALGVRRPPFALCLAPGPGGGWVVLAAVQDVGPAAAPDAAAVARAVYAPMLEGERARSIAVGGAERAAQAQEYARALERDQARARRAAILAEAESADGVRFAFRNGDGGRERRRFAGAADVADVFAWAGATALALPGPPRKVVRLGDVRGRRVDEVDELKRGGVVHVFDDEVEDE